MQISDPASLAMRDIAVARCETLDEARAMGRWILPVFQEWPSSAWHVWLIDATDCGDIRAAEIGGKAIAINWRSVETDSFARQDAVCSLLGNHYGLVVLAPHAITALAVRKLEGLVPRLTSFAVTDPLAQSFRKPLASFGIALAA